jgi:acyl carrier protein
LAQTSFPKISSADTFISTDTPFAQARQTALDPPNAALLGNPWSIPAHYRELVLRARDASEAAIRDWCVEYLARTLDLPDHTIDPEMTFARMGLDSANSVFFIVELEDWLGLELAPELLFEHPTIGELSRHLATRAGP